MSDDSKERTKMTAGLDLGDRYSRICLLDTDSGEVVEESRLRTTPDDLCRRFGSDSRLTIALEVGTHSPWASRLLSDCGHEVLVANPRRTRLIYGEGRKTDKLDAEKLARLARVDPKLLSPLEHRGEASQAHLALIRSREVVVRSRAQLINHVRGTVKSFGARLPKCSTASFHKKVAACIPEELRPALEPLLETIVSLSTRVRHYDRELEQLAQEHYPQTKLLRQV
jgi:transposase